MEIEAWEMPRILRLAKRMKERKDEKGQPIKYKFLPAWAVAPRGAMAPERIISYWLMGRLENGDMCPFLSTPDENIRTEDGTLKCLIYEERPLQCKAYPVHAIYLDKMAGEKVARLDMGCQSVMEMLMKGDQRLSRPVPMSLLRGLDFGSLVRLQSGNKVDSKRDSLWAYPTGVFEDGKKPELVIDGWVEVAQS